MAANKNIKVLVVDDEKLIFTIPISNIETAKSAPGINLLSKLLLDYNVNLNYIIGGMGDIFITKDKTYESLRASLIKEVELFLDNRGIN